MDSGSRACGQERYKYPYSRRFVNTRHGSGAGHTGTNPLQHAAAQRMSLVVPSGTPQWRTCNSIFDATSTGHRAQGTGHRAQGTGHRAQGPVGGLYTQGGTPPEPCLQLWGACCCLCTYRYSNKVRHRQTVERAPTSFCFISLVMLGPWYSSHRLLNLAWS